MNGYDFKFVQEERHTELVNSVTLLSVTRCKQSFWVMEQTSNNLLDKETLLSAVLGFERNRLK